MQEKEQEAFDWGGLAALEGIWLALELIYTKGGTVTLENLHQHLKDFANEVDPTGEIRVHMSDTSQSNGMLPYSL